MVYSSLCNNVPHKMIRLVNNFVKCAIFICYLYISQQEHYCLIINIYKSSIAFHIFLP